jgi:NAD(P)-dependent dehydrogenase (short-subunit alcohol dehydrogenase family)
MARRFAEKVALVTGAATGIGRATALAFAAAGARVVVADIAAGGAETVAAIRAVGGEATYVRCDVAEPMDVAAMIAAAVRWAGRIDCAFNNAGIEGERAPLAEQSDESWARLLAVNLSGVRHCLKHELAHMLKRPGGGAIVNCASILGHVAYDNASADVAAKHGVIGLTRAAALEVASHAIRVNAISPAFVETPMLARAGVLATPATRAAATALHPLGRLGQAEEIAAATLFLCSEDASFVTGHALVADGGYLCR